MVHQENNNQSSGNMECTPCVDKSNLDPCPEINTDHRKRFEWQSHYPKEAHFRIICETAWAFFILIMPLAFILGNWEGSLTNSFFVECESKKVMHIYSLYLFSGMLGGATYGAKYLYRTVGRGYWHCDRIVWRFMSPFVSMVLGLIIGTLVESAILNVPGGVSLGRCIAIGFMSGYFADQAVGKMCDVAEVIFGKPSRQS